MSGPLTEFARRCMDGVQPIVTAARSCTWTGFALVTGQKETYHLGVLSCVGRTIELFVYHDEAGIMIDGEIWRPFEAPDFDGSDALISAFAEGVKREIESITRAAPKTYD